MAARKNTAQTPAGFAVTLTAQEVFAIQDFAELERGEALKRIADAANSGEVDLVRETLGSIDTCAALAVKMGEVVEQMPRAKLTEHEVALLAELIENGASLRQIAGRFAAKS